MANVDASLSKNLPAPKTFAPSREDVLSTLGFFFGDPAVPEKLKDYSEHHAMTYHFPDGKHLHATQRHTHTTHLNVLKLTANCHSVDSQLSTARTRKQRYP